ncbi:hypothetical protein EAI_05453, partial [Harpegnathos saltator]
QLIVGWSWAKVRVLEERPLQCYKCLSYGHIAVTCQFNEGLGGHCFRCGGAVHVARGCTSEVRCILCQKEGRDATHRMGGRAC